jgi:hypothetical protein
MSFLDDDSVSTTNVEIRLIGKWPIPLRNRFAIFPLFGVDFKIALARDPSLEGGGDSPFEMLSNVWFNWGWGADFALTERIYLRPELLYGLGTNSKLQRDEIDDANRTTKMIDNIINHGLDVRLVVGNRF